MWRQHRACSRVGRGAALVAFEEAVLRSHEQEKVFAHGNSSSATLETVKTRELSERRLHRFRRVTPKSRRATRVTRHRHSPGCSMKSQKKHLLLYNRVHTKAVIAIIPARQSVKERHDEFQKSQGTEGRSGFLRAGQHPLPRTLVLCRRLHGNAEFICSPQDKMWIAQELAREQDDVRLALRQQVVRLLGCRDHSHDAHSNVRMCLLDRLRKRNLDVKKKWEFYHATNFLYPFEICVPGIPARRKSSALPSFLQSSRRSGQRQASSARR